MNPLEPITPHHEKPGAGRPVATAAPVIAQGAPRPSSRWGQAILIIAALSAAGFVGFLGLAFLLVVVLIAVAPNHDSAEATADSGIVAEITPADAMEPRGAGLVDPTIAQTSSTQVASTETANTDAPSAANDEPDEALKAMQDLLAVLKRRNAGAREESETDSTGQLPDAIGLTTAGSELSEELKALSPQEATQAAEKYLAPAEREAHGRTALLLLDRAARAGNARAMYLLFFCYWHGVGHPADEARALAWLQKSAEAGDPAGMHAYSSAIRKGQYKDKDETESLAWLQRSAQSGNPAASNEIKARQVEAVVGALGSLFSSQSSEEGSDVPQYACDGANDFFGGHCNCQGFVVGGIPSDPSDFICRSCFHAKEYHYR